MEPHRRVQHPRQPVHDLAAGGHARRAPAVHADPRAVHRRLHPRRPEPAVLVPADGLSSITSYSYRDILVVRDAGALTSSITGGTIGLPEDIYTLDSPLDDVTKSHVLTQELRLAGGQGRARWLVGGFFSSNTRKYGQSL